MRSWFISEDWFAVWVGAIVVALAVPAAAGYDLLGWIAAPQVWLEAGQAVKPVSKAFAGLPGPLSLLFTYLFLLCLLGAGAAVQRFDLHKFLLGFTAIFWISVASWLLGHYAYIAQTPDKRAAMGISWSLGLTGEAGYLIALLQLVCWWVISCPGWRPGSRWRLGRNGSSRRRS